MSKSVHLSPFFTENGGTANDGSIAVMQGDIPVLRILLRVEAKRGEAYKVKDPTRDAFARFVVKAINDAYARGENP